MEPEVGLLPLHPPEELQLVAFVVVQLKVADEPLLMVVEPGEPFARRSTVGAAGLGVVVGAGVGAALTFTVTESLLLPPGPVQVIV